jgi:hypothetical protein
MQNYIKKLNYQTFYQKKYEKSFFLSRIDSNQGKNDKNMQVICVREQQTSAWRADVWVVCKGVVC